jgi:adenylate cyclase
MEFTDLGEQSLKNIAEPVHVYRVGLGERSGGIAAASDAIFRRPAVAVLPFENMSGDAEQEYFSDGLTEDIITALSLWRSFPVIARNSTFAYKGQSPDIRKVGKELGARYVVEGSVRKAGDRLRITVQLIDAQSGHHVWADRFDRKLDDIFELQDEISNKIAAEIEPELARVEHDRTLNRQTENLPAWELYSQGAALVYSPTRDDHLRARELLEAATRLDPNFSRALAMLGMTYHRDLYQGSNVPREEILSKMTEICSRAVKAGPRDATAHTVLGLNYNWRGEHEKALAAAERAITLNPSEAAGRIVAGMVLDLMGRSAEALQQLENGARLNPNDPRNAIFETITAQANLAARRYEAAIEWASKALQTREDYNVARVVLASALGHLGRGDEVSSAIQLEHFGRPEIEPVLTIWSRYKVSAIGDHMVEGLRKAGLVE